MKDFFTDIQHFFMFYGIEEKECKKIISSISPRYEEYKKGDLVFSREQNGHAVGFILSGECEILRLRNGGNSVLLNRITTYDSFGILSVFSADDDYPTEIFARKNTAVLFFTKKDILSLIENNHKISLNVINFLSSRIAFLNRKIAAFSAGTTEEKLASFLYSEYLSHGPEFALNCKRCSEALGIGRASVYRGLDALVTEGLIKFENKKIYIICPQRLERN